MSLISQTSVLSRPAADNSAPRKKDLPPLDHRIVDGARWDRSVSAFDGVCQEQLFAYAKLRWPGVALEPVLFSERGELLGGALVMLQRLPLGLATIALVKWGPFLADNRAGDADVTMRRIIDAMVAEYADRRGMMVSIMPKAEAGEDSRLLWALAERGFKPGVKVKYPLRYIVDVTLDDDA